ncbi:uncharacterized protein NEMAJ01_1399 [Nematocida major]|uniref:uncharacterized protein n=1 Tax=Nematocida major TaxID=1912982 RepID=UPI00200865F3|nr:uncharacterized protein NEMAJ01_1399 [Nematocida major]KAH9386503.1 hypothetical protein NEMAJ01_1399 [Nematocida major]
MKNKRALRALLSTAGQYFTQNKDKYPGALDRMGRRIGARLPIVHGLGRSCISHSQDTWGRAISNRILRCLGIEDSSHGISSSSGRVIVKIPKLWETDDPSMALPVFTAVIERVFSGWHVPVRIEVNLDKSILLAIVPEDKNKEK